MRKIILIFSCLSVALSSFGQGASIWNISLAEAKDYAKRYHPTVGSAMLDIAKAEERINEIRASGLPQINASVDLNHYLKQPVSIIPSFDPTAPEGTTQELVFGTKNNLTAGLSAQQLVFDASFFQGLKLAEIYSELAKKQAQQTALETQFKVEQAYLSALIAKENIKLLENNMPTINRILFETEQLYINGFAEAVEVDRLVLSKSNLETQIANLQEQQDLAVELLAFQMGYGENKQLVLTDDLDGLMNMDVMALDAKAEAKNRIEYKVMQTQNALNDMNIKTIESRYYPSVAAYGNYQWAAQRDKFNYLNLNEPWFNTFIIGLNVNVPIFDGFLKRSQIEQAKIDKEKISYATEILDQAVALEIKQAKTNYTNALIQKQSQDDNLKLAKKIYDTALIKYKEGLGSSLEVNAAESALLETQANYINSLYNLILAKSDINKAYGKY